MTPLRITCFRKINWAAEKERSTLRTRNGECHKTASPESPAKTPEQGKHKQPPASTFRQMNNEMSRAHESPYEISLAGQGETERFQQEITRKTDGDANNAINQNQWRTIEWWMPVARVNLDAPHHLGGCPGSPPHRPSARHWSEHWPLPVQGAHLTQIKQITSTIRNLSREVHIWKLKRTEVKEW